MPRTPDLPQFRDQVAECAPELAALGQVARHQALRLSFHAGQHIVLNSPDPALVQRSTAELMVLASILDEMSLGPEAVVVTHLGGVYEDHVAARARFVANFLRLPEPVRRRLVLENDDLRYSVDDTLWVHAWTGLRLVFDYLHHRLHNPLGLTLREALTGCLATWPAAITPKIHFSSPRTELRVETGRANKAPRLHPPRWNYHSDYLNPFEFLDFLRTMDGLRPFDIMLEARARDLALLQLRDDQARFAPDLEPVVEQP